MDKWEDIITEKTLSARPYEPQPSWEKMAELLDEELPIAAFKIHYLRTLAGLAASIVVIGVLTIFVIRSFYPEKKNPTLVVLSTPGFTAPEITTEPCGEIPSKVNLRPLQERKITNSEKLPAIEQVKSADFPAMIPSQSESKLFSQNHKIPPVAGLRTGIKKTLSLPEKDISLSPAPLPGASKGSEIRRYASLAVHRVQLALGPGEKMKWARSKWALNFHTSINRVPVKPVVIQQGNQSYSYYSPVMPGLGAEISYLPNPKWEFGLHAGIDAIWYPLELTPDNPDDFTDLFGLGIELGAFSRRYLVPNRERRFRPYVVGAVGLYSMDMYLTQFDAPGLVEWEPNSWNARKKEPDLQNLHILYEPVNLTSLTGGAGLGLNIRMYRRLSFNYQSSIFGNLPVKRTAPDLLENFHGYAWQWKNTLGFTLSI